MEIAILTLVSLFLLLSFVGILTNDDDVLKGIIATLCIISVAIITLSTVQSVSILISK